MKETQRLRLLTLVGLLGTVAQHAHRMFDDGEDDGKTHHFERDQVEKVSAALDAFDELPDIGDGLVRDGWNTALTEAQNILTDLRIVTAHGPGPHETVDANWLAQLRREYSVVSRQRDELQWQVDRQWRPMDTAPVDRQILLKRPRWFGGTKATMVAGIGRWETQPYHKKPKPYWRDSAQLSVVGDQQSIPVGWMELPT